MTTMVLETPHVFSAARTRLRMTRRGRVVLTTLAGASITAAVLLLCVGQVSPALGGADHPAVAFDSITVTSQDSLWTIAQRIAPNADPRDVIQEIVTLNNLGETRIQPGQRLALPTYQ